MYKMIVYKVWDGKVLQIRHSNSLEYFDRYKGKENYRIVIKDGNKVVYSEVAEC